MLLISAFIIAISKTPGAVKTKQKKNNISLRPAQRERIKTKQINDGKADDMRHKKIFSLVLVCTLAIGLSLTSRSKDEIIWGS